MTSYDDFESAVQGSRNLSDLSNDTLLELYGLFKQATQGDVHGDAPGMFDFKGRAKHDAWSSRQGMSSEDAKQAYIDLVNRLAG